MKAFLKYNEVIKRGQQKSPTVMLAEVVFVRRIRNYLSLLKH
jgi:hypothetical protein